MVVHKRIGAQLGLRQMGEADHRDQFEAQLLRRQPDAMARDDPPAIINHNWPDNAEMHERIGQQIYLCDVVGPGVALRRLEAFGRQHLDHPRQPCREREVRGPI